MYSKAEFVDLIIESLNGGVPPDQRKYHKVVVSKYIDAAMNTIIAADVKQSKALGQFDLDPGWIKVVDNIKLKWDQIRNQVYIVWPKNVLYMAGMMGIREIGWNFQDGSPSFRIMDPSAYQVISNLECSQLDTGVHFALVESKRVYFPDIPKVRVTENRKVMAKVVLSFSAYEDDDEVPVPEERVIEVVRILQEMMGGFRITKQKVSNDTNPNTI